MTSKKRERRRRRARDTAADDTAKKVTLVLKTKNTEGGSVRTVSTGGATIHVSSSKLSSSSSLSTDGFVAAGVVVLVISLILRNIQTLRRIFSPFINCGKHIIRSPAVRVIIVFLMSILLLVLLFIVVVRIGKGNKISRTLSSEMIVSTTKVKDKDAEIPTVQPLRLRPFVMETTGDSDTEYNNNNNNDEYDHDHTPVLAKSKLVRTKLAEWLPFGLRYTSDINLVFSTNIHGRSLSILYNQLEKTSSRHTILLLEVLLPQRVSSLSSSPSSSTLPTLRRLVVGMYASQLWHCSSKLYGDGQCFLFRLIEELDDNDHNKENNCNRKNCNDNNKNKECISEYSELIITECWKWKPPPSSFASTTSYNNNTTPITNNSDFNNTITNTTALWETFQRSNQSSLSMGVSDCGSGAGLKLNYDLTIGESYCAVGFNNDPLVKKIEVETITNNNNNSNNDNKNCSEHDKKEEGSVSGGVIFDIGLVEVYQLVREIDGVPIQ